MVVFVTVLILVLHFFFFPPVPPIQPKVPRPATPARSSATADTTSQLLHFTQGQEQQATLVLPVEQDKLFNLQHLYVRVAARSLGEGAFALPEIACTMKNRLQRSRASLSGVLRAYHAADVAPQPHHVELVRKVFEGELPCPATWWYALSLQDTHYWRPHQRPPVKIVESPGQKQILIFDH